METKRKALGKGLEQLFNSEQINFDSFEQNIVDTASDNEIREIPISEIRSNPYQPREHFDPEALDELANSIKEHGVIEPIIVKKSIHGYELVAGERRIKASELAGKKTIPAIVKDFSDEQMMDIAILENIQREDLSPIELADGFSKYIERTGLTQEEIAKKFGKSRSYITNLLGLLSLPKIVRDEINNGKLTMSHARALSKLDDQDLISDLALKVINEGISVRELEKMCSGDELKKKKPLNRTYFRPTKFASYEGILRDKIGTKVQISKNKITIPFDSEGDLDRILEILKIDVDDE
jgi:ParB family chromosome partitioning protein